MHCVFWGTYDEGKPRVRILRRGLMENGVQVTTCHRMVWGGVEDKSQVRGLKARLGLGWKWLSAYPSLLWRYLSLPKHDVVVVSYLGHLDVLLLWPLAKLRGAPIVWDAFLSLYNTVVEDRKMVGPHHPLARLLYAWEWLACRAADLVVLDTAAHATYFARRFHLPKQKTAAVFVGAEPEAFPRLPTKVRLAGSPLTVLFYGQFIPLHGIETIIGAARLLRDENVEWVIIGQGQEAEKIRGLLAETPLPKLRWLNWVAYTDLQQWINKADLCLGIFGTSEKAAMVIPNKVFQILLSGKPLVTRDSPAMRELCDCAMAGVDLLAPGNTSELARSVSDKARLNPSVLNDDEYAKLFARVSPLAIGASLLSEMRVAGIPQ